jgi:tRNA uridine 5-carbamoylmethylation protein Kti12
MDQRRASIILLCGLPGSGKSSVAQNIVQAYSKCGDDDDSVGVKEDEFSLTQNDKVVIIEYDAIEQDIRQQQSIDGKYSSQFTSDDLDAWRKSRITALNVLKNTLSDHFCGSDNDNHASSLLIILDDNFHLRSMRRDIYRACQEFLTAASGAVISFSVAYIKTPLHVCLERNNLRRGKQNIPPDIITRMDATIEPPDDSKPYASFERFHVTIDNTASDLKFNQEMLHTIDQCVKTALQSPVEAKKELTSEEITQIQTEKEFQRQQTSKCQVQRIDLLLRRLVGAVGKVDKKRSKEANDTRKAIIEKVRSEHTTGGTSDENAVQQFACKMLGIDVAENWQSANCPLTNEIQHSFQEFLSSTSRDD